MFLGSAVPGPSLTVFRTWPENGRLLHWLHQGNLRPLRTRCAWPAGELTGGVTGQASDALLMQTVHRVVPELIVLRRAPDLDKRSFQNTAQRACSVVFETTLGWDTAIYFTLGSECGERVGDEAALCLDKGIWDLVDNASYANFPSHLLGPVADLWDGRHLVAVKHEPDRPGIN